MTRRAALGMLLLGGASVAARRHQTFRAATEAVIVSASVERSNRIVTGLTARDFAVSDNGVAQTVDSVTVDSLPIDLTIVYDTSPSQSHRLDRFKDDIRRMAAMLRAEDRLRVLAFGADRQVVDLAGWQPPAAELQTDRAATVPVSLVNDAPLLALVHRPAAGRRHLIVALTDGVDAGSAATAREVQTTAERADAVLHLVLMGRTAGPSAGGAGNFVPTGAEDGGRDRLKAAATLSGGAAHDRLAGSPDPVAEFANVFTDFRQTYVIRYAPSGVDPGGWHRIEVSVPGLRGAVVRARHGYFGR